MAARKRTWTPDIVRERIRVSMIVNRLEKHVHGKVKMAPTQVTAALGLLRKCIPDLSSTDHTGEMIFKHAHELSDAALADIAAGSGNRAAQAPPSPKDPSSVH